MKPEFELAKKLKGPSQMLRVQAARAIIEATRANADRTRELELHAFMSIFHPEYSEAQVRKLVRG